ncbi:MAG TPA: beta-ketoacyl synthase N-terminal-like domain-containing protein [Candidatus Limnocylindrales bacterium]|nr:beta-ketoacyl synthase N-terminal-like domain-containing protein [Candidatus Limnocylindrales bacterium]
MTVTIRARASVSGTAPPLAGFVASSFSPLAAESARQCLSDAGPVVERTAVIIVSASGDLGTARATSEAVDAGRRPGPLLFFQAVPNAVAGYIATQHGLRGPVVCLSPAGPAEAEGIAVADLLIRDGDADEALVILVEQSPDDPESGMASAVLVKSN